MLPITLNRASGPPLFRQIALQIRSAVDAGVLKPPGRLPTIRDLARHLGVNRLTVARAYTELAREGFVRSFVGRGTFLEGEHRHGPGRPEDQACLAWGPMFARGPQRAVQLGLAAEAAGGSDPGLVSLASLFPDPGLFPVEAFGRAVRDVLRDHGPDILGYGPPAGYAPLRRMIADGLRARGITASDQDVVITSGSQQGIDLVARALLDPGDRVVMGDPSYTGAVQVFESYGAELSGVEIDGEGMVVEMLEDAVEQKRPKLIYVMPNFQNPTSRTLSPRRRQAVVDLARSRRIVVLEDDFGADLRYEGEELPCLRALPGAADCVVYMSTFGKKLLPGLRIGWLAAPRPLAKRLIELKQIADYGTSLVLQAALYEFCRRGELERHLTHVVAQYRQRRDAMLESMASFFPHEVAWTRPEGGLVVWVTLPEGVQADEITGAAREQSVLIGCGDLFYLGGGRHRNLRLTFSQATPGQIRRGVRILGRIIHQHLKSRGDDLEQIHREALPLI